MQCVCRARGEFDWSAARQAKGPFKGQAGQLASRPAFRQAAQAAIYTLVLLSCAGWLWLYQTA